MVTNVEFYHFYECVVGADAVLIDTLSACILLFR